MKADFHLHSSFSGDAKIPMELMVKRGIELGLDSMCFTEHQDYDYPYDEPDFALDIESYQKTLITLKEKYRSKIQLLFGIELGLQPHLAKRHEELVRTYPFDFVIGSSHLVNQIDPYHAVFFEGRPEEEAYGSYFESIIHNIQAFSSMDVYGHIDYILRYGPNKNKNFTYERYQDVLERVLLEIIHKGIGLEVNSAGYKYGLDYPNPHPDIVKRYREMGGEIITIGSDAHSAEHIAYEFGRVADLLKSCGFRYYTEYHMRKPVFIKI